MKHQRDSSTMDPTPADRVKPQPARRALPAAATSPVAEPRRRQMDSHLPVGRALPAVESVTRFDRLDSNVASVRPAVHALRGPRASNATRRVDRSLAGSSIVGLMLFFFVGCQSATVKEPLTRTVGGNAADQQLEFWHQLAERPVTSYDEAFHGLLLYTDTNDPANDYAGRVTSLKSKGLLAAGFDRPADEAVDRGTLAIAMARVLEIKGGILMHVLKSSPRYAVRELQYLNVFPPSSQNQTFSGAEFLGIMAKAEEYQHLKTRGTDAAVGASPEEPLRGAVEPAATQETAK